MPPILPTPSQDFSVPRPPQRSTAPAAVGRSATPTALVLGLQRSHGNQALARSVSQHLARHPTIDAPPAAAGRSWAEQTTVENKPLGSEIDKLEKLTDDALANERETVADSKHGSLIHVFHEYVVARAFGSKSAARAFRQAIAAQTGPGVGGARLYSNIWDALFDEYVGNSPHIAENLGEILIRRLGFEGDLELKAP